MMTYVTPETLDRKTDQWLRKVQSFKFHTDWTLNPSKAALLVIDCQNFFVSEPKPDGVPILPRIWMLIDSFRKAGRPVIFTRHMHKTDGSDLGVLGEWWPENIIENTPESEIHPALEVRPDDIVIRKNVYSSFVGTDLENILRKLGVTDLVIAGVMTNLCCETAARDAFCRNFRVFFPADANATATEEMHIASLINIGYGFGAVVRAREIEQVMMKRTQP
jgi:nicotinamidase-related amidase